jgi:hypothetical protein
MIRRIGLGDRARRGIVRSRLDHRPLARRRAKEAGMYCPRCGLKQPVEHRFCVSCGTALPGQLLEQSSPKVSRWFPSIPVSPIDPPQGALRVTRYLEEFEMETAEGSVRVPSHHVRFSIWADDRALAALSIPDDEARELAQFLLAPVPGGTGSTQESVPRTRSL